MTWNHVAHIGFRRIFLTDEWPSTTTSLVVMFSFESIPSVVLATRFPLEEHSGDPTDVARAIGDAFIHLVWHEAKVAASGDGPRLRWVAPTPLP